VPLFFFDIIHQGIVEIDGVGLEFPDLASAVKDARAAARKIAEETLPSSPLASVSIQVRDGPGTPVVTVLVRASADMIEATYTTRPV
jgi:hypothetical protein